MLDFLRSHKKLLAVIGLVLLLSAHLNSRLRAHAKAPLEGRTFYPQCFGSSISLLLGGECERLPLATSHPESRPLQEFILLRRDHVTPDQLAAYWTARDKVKPDLSVFEDQYCTQVADLEARRILEVYIVAALWKVFGVSWSIFFTFYSLVSTLACFCVFGMAYKLSGRYGLGMLAAGLYLLSPFELTQTVTNTRDISPTWFTAFAFGWLICATDQFRRRSWNLLSLAVLGFITLIGLGWRNDIMLLAPVILGAALIGVWIKRRSLGAVAMAGVCCVAGMLGAAGILKALAPPIQPPKLFGFHMAYYAESVRTNLAGVENNFSVAWNDMTTMGASSSYHAHHPHDPDENWYLAHGSTCLAMSLELYRFNAFRWACHFPVFYWHALNNFSYRDTMMAPTEKFHRQGVSIEQLKKCRPHRWGFLFEAAPAIPWLFALGAISVWLARGVGFQARMLFLFSMYYAGVMWLVLPMHKHFGMLLPPLAVIGGLAPLTIESFALWRRRRNIESGESAFRQRLTRFAAGGLALTCVVLLLTWTISVRERRSYVQEILTRAKTAVDAKEFISDSKTFRASLAPDAADDVVGFLLQIEAGAKPGHVVCGALRRTEFLEGQDNEVTTWHSLKASRSQWLFITCVNSSRYSGFVQNVFWTARIEGDARIVDCKRVDMRDWKRLQFVGVIEGDGLVAGSPPIAHVPTQHRFLHLFPLLHSPQLDQVVRFSPTGQWTTARWNGSQLATTPIGAFSSQMKWIWVASADFTGDGRDDVVAVSDNHDVWLGAAGIVDLQNELWGHWPSTAPNGSYHVGDFNADGRSDIAYLNVDTGEWTVGLSTGKGFKTSVWSDWSGSGDWRDVQVGDFNGDGRSDVAARCADNGDWRVAVSTGAGFETKTWGHWSHDADWTDVRVGDFNGDGKADIVGRTTDTSNWWVCAFNRQALRYGAVGPMESCRPLARRSRRRLQRRRQVGPRRAQPGIR